MRIRVERPMSNHEARGTIEMTTRSAAMFDLAFVFAATTGAYLAEKPLRELGVISWPEAANGLLGVAASALSVVALQLMRRRRWADLGFRRPQRLWALPIWALAMLAVFLIVQNGSVLVLRHYIDIPPPELGRYDFLYQNAEALASMLGVVWLTASLPEELVYRGFVFDRLTRIFGAGPLSTFIVLLLQAAFFGLVHFHAGWGGVIITSTMGLVWGVFYILAGRNLWPLILGHYFTDAFGVISLFLVKGSSIGAG